MHPLGTAVHSTTSGRPSAPRLPPELVHRTALVERIEHAFAVGPLVVVHGPPRAGGTTLVADWAADTAADVAWVRADTALDDRAAFWRVVGDACDVTVPDVASATFRADLVRAFAHLPDAVADPAWRLVIVLDAAHLVRSVAIRTDLTAVLDGTRCLGAVLVGHEPLDRADPLRDLLPVVVDGVALAMTPHDASALLGRTVSAIVAPATVARTTASVAGHTGILAEAARTLAADRAPTTELAVRFATAVDRAAADWIDTALPAGGLRDTIRRLAVVDRMPVAVAATIAADAESVLRTAARLGLGALTDGLPGADGVFRWHPAAANALRREHRVGSHELLRTVADQAVDHDEPVTAVEAAVRLGDLDLLTDVVRVAWTRIAGPDAAAVSDLLDAVRPRNAAAHPLVLAAIARAASAADRHHARASRAHAATVPAVAARLRDATPDEAVLLHAVEAQARRVNGDERGSHRAAVAAERTLAALDASRRDRLAPSLPFVLEQIAATALADGDVEKSLATLARIEPDVGADGAAQRSSALGMTALVHALVGEVAVARRLLDGPEVVDGVTATLARALVVLEGGDAAAAIELLDGIDPLFGAYDHWPIVLAARARATSVLGRVSAADHLAEFDAEYERFRLRSAPTGVGARLVARARIRLLLAAGQLHRAEEALAALGPAMPWTAAERAGLRLVRDEPEPALDVVTDTLVHGTYEPRRTAVLGLLRAVAAQRAGDDDVAGEAFRSALDTFERTGLRGELLTAPRADVEALAASAARGGDDRALRWLAPLDGLRSVLPDVGDAVVLSERESVVLGLLAGPLTLPDVAAELHVSVNTVKTQVRSVYRKLGVSGRRPAVERARELGVLAV